MPTLIRKIKIYNFHSCRGCAAFSKCGAGVVCELSGFRNPSFGCTQDGKPLGPCPKPKKAIMVDRLKNLAIHGLVEFSFGFPDSYLATIEPE